MAIRAPFNFVPVSDKVFFPDWADQIQHDIPFSDGVSGTIKLKITAESPIFVRNGHTEKDREEKNENYQSFSNVEGQYFIPGTSIKGAIRNVLEILSFGKMQFIDNKRYSIRDLQLNDYKKAFQENEVHCGWMRKDGDKIIIADHGVPYRVSHKEIDNHFKTNFCSEFKDSNFFKKEDNKSSLYKYAQLKGASRDLYFKLDTKPRNEVDKRKFVSILPSGSLQGKLVFTGQPGIRKDKRIGKNGKPEKATGKFYEFIFPEKSLKEFEFDFYEKEGVYADFQFIHKDSVEWDYWKKKINKGEKIPVFMIVNDTGIVHFGLSYLYKLPFNKKVKGYLPDNHNKKDLDLSECIFGSTNNKSIKGRVSFSNAFSTKATPLDLMEVYMGSPKPTYYPIYLKQKGENGFLHEKSKGFSTMLKDNAELKGWKKYHLRNSHVTDFEIPAGQENNTNKFIPLDSGAEFLCNVKFHNLKREELGAILYSIESKNNSFHNIGFAKAYGFGKIKIEIIDIIAAHGSLIAKEDTINSFVALMSDNIEDYFKQEQIKQLNLLQRVNNLSTTLEYMPLTDFVTYKRHNPQKDVFGQYLKYTSEYILHEEKKQATTEAEAVVTVVSGHIIQAKLVTGKDTRNKTLIIPQSLRKPKIGDKIKVKLILKGGNIDQLEFIAKL